MLSLVLKAISMTKLFDTKNVAERLKVSTKTVLKLVDEGCLECINITRNRKRRTLRFTNRHISRYLDANHILLVTDEAQPKPKSIKRQSGGPLSRMIAERG